MRHKRPSLATTLRPITPLQPSHRRAPPLGQRAGHGVTPRQASMRTSPTELCGYDTRLPDGRVLFGRGAVAPTATPIVRAGRIARIPTRVEDFVANNRHQKLFPHFSEAGTAIFAVKHVEYDEHDRTLT